MKLIEAFAALFTAILLTIFVLKATSNSHNGALFLVMVTITTSAFLFVLWRQPSDKSEVTETKIEIPAPVDQTEKSSLTYSKGLEGPKEDFPIWWTIGIAAGVLLWAYLVNFILYASSHTSLTKMEKLSEAVGIGLFPFLGTGALAVFSWYLTGSWRKAMWTWTIALLIVLLVLSIGGIQVAKKM